MVNQAQKDGEGRGYVITIIRGVCVFAQLDDIWS